MEILVEELTCFFLEKHLIESDQAEWLRYGLSRRLMGLFTFLLLLPVGAVLVGWVESFLFVATFRFLRTRTGGYHAKTSYGCLLASLSIMIVSLTLAKFILSPILSIIVLIVALFSIWVLAPANNAALHLTKSEIEAIRVGVVTRLAMIALLECLLLYVSISAANCVAVSALAVAAMLWLANLGVGIQ